MDEGKHLFWELAALRAQSYMPYSMMAGMSAIAARRIEQAQQLVDLFIKLPITNRGFHSHEFRIIKFQPDRKYNPSWYVSKH